jgi:phage antirepressor YoqD-like protein
MNNLSIANNEVLTMSSQEIANLTGKSVGHIHRDFKVMILELGYGTPSNPFLDLDDTPIAGKYPDIINISQAAKLAGLTRKTIYKHINDGKIIRSDNGIHKDELKRVYGLDFASNESDLDISDADFTYITDGSKRITSILMNQELTMTLVSGYNVKLRNAIIKRWQELEQLQAPVSSPQIPTNFAEALQLAADQAKQLELAAPKVAFVDNFVERESLQNATQVAQSLKLSSARKLNSILDEIGGIYSGAVKRSRVFTVKFINNGYGDIKQTEQGYPQSLFTTKGIVYLNELLTSEGYI